MYQHAAQDQKKLQQLTQTQNAPASTSTAPPTEREKINSSIQNTYSIYNAPIVNIIFELQLMVCTDPLPNVHSVCEVGIGRLVGYIAPMQIILGRCITRQSAAPRHVTRIFSTLRGRKKTSPLRCLFYFSSQPKPVFFSLSPHPLLGRFLACFSCLKEVSPVVGCHFLFQRR